MNKNSFLILLLFIIVSVNCSGQQIYDIILKAKVLTNTGKSDQAINILSTAIDEKGTESRLFVERAEAKMIIKDYTGAITDLNTANSITPDCGEYGLAKVYSLKGDAANAAFHLERNLNSKYKKSEKEIMLDPSFVNIENRPEWRQVWKKDWYPSYERAVSEIEYSVSRGKTIDAKETLSELRSEYTNHPAALYADAVINVSERKFAEAIKTLTGLISLEPENEKFLRLLARAQSGNGNYAGASDIYSKLLNLEVPDAGLLISRAECYIKTGETKKALADIERYLAIDQEDKAAISMAGKGEAASGDNLKAITYFSKNLELHPNDAACYVDRGNAYFLSKTWDWAIKDYSMSLDLNPNNPDAWLNKGLSLLNSGRTSDACHDFKIAMSLGNKKASEYISRNCIK